jgi:hypothetical protein
MLKALQWSKLAKKVATDREINGFADQFGFQLPPVFVEFCKKYNGGLPSDENNCLFVPRRFEGFCSEYFSEGGFLSIDGLYGLTSDPAACNVSKALFSFRAQYSIPLFPVSFDIMGNYVVLMAKKLQGPVFFLDHELWEKPSVPTLFPISDDIESFYNGLTSNT